MLEGSGDMSTLLGFLGGIALALLAHVIGVLIILAREHGKWPARLRGLRRAAISIWREMVSAKSIVIYTNRDNLRRLFGPISKYVNEAENSLDYYGIQFYTVEDGGVIAGLKTFVEGGGRFSCFFLRPNSTLVPYYSRFLNRSESVLREQLEDTKRKLLECKRSLHADAQSRFKIHTHEELLTASCFVFDRDKGAPKILIDHKLFGQDRAMSYGVEIRSKDHPLLLGALASFSNIRALAKEV